MKLSEIIFHGTDTHIKVFTTTKHYKDMRENKGKPTYGMVVSKDGQNFKEVLSKVKSVISDSEGQKIAAHT